MMKIKLFRGDCLKVMGIIPDNSIDLVLADPPYGVTACKWDSVIPLEPMWCQLKRITKPKSVIALMSSQPFTTTLISSNLKMFKYSWVWEKNFSTNFFHAKTQPLRKHEEIIVFYRKSGKYFPIKTSGHIPTQSAVGSSPGKLYYGTNRQNYKGGDTTRYPTTIIRIDAVDPKKRLHPLQKPVDLLEYLINTYTRKGEMVLDFTSGSGSTGIACLNLKRRCILIEKELKYVRVTEKRIGIKRQKYLS